MNINIEFPNKVDTKSKLKQLSLEGFAMPYMNKEMKEVPIMRKMDTNLSTVVTSYRYLEFSILPRLKHITIEKNTRSPMLYGSMQSLSLSLSSCGFPQIVQLIPSVKLTLPAAYLIAIAPYMQMVRTIMVKTLIHLPTWSLVKVEYSIFLQMKKGLSFLSWSQSSRSGFDEFRGA